MSLKSPKTWWSQHSIAGTLYNKASTFNEAHRLVKQESILPQEKHTFFPGNEISRDRIQFYPKFLIRPDSYAKMTWDLIIFLATLYLCISIPYSISYLSDFPKEIYFLISSFFLFDIAIGLNSSFFIKGTMVANRSEVAGNYIKKWLIIDILSGFPLEFCIRLDRNENYPDIINLSTEYSRLFLLLKLLKVFKIKLILDNFSDLSTGSIYYITSQIFITLIYVIIPVHWMNCAYNIFYCYNLERNYYYWDKPIISTYERYLKFLERIMETIISVGYGDFPIRSTGERILIIIFMLMTSGFLGFIVGSIENTIANSAVVENYFRRIQSNLKNYAEKHKLPKNLRFKVNSYVRHLRFTYNNNLIQDEDIIKILSIPLREEIFLHTKGYILIGVSFFANFSRPCIRALGYKMNLQIYGPQDEILTQDELTNTMYFITSGTVQMFHAESKTIFIVLHKEHIFGELSFLLNQARTASAQASSFSELFTLNRFDFDKILETMPKDKEKFNIIIRNLKNYGLAVIGMYCYLCGSCEHLAKNCERFIWKPKLNKLNYDRRKRVNPENTPLMNFRKNKATAVKYSVQNTKGMPISPYNLYSDNRYLAKKSVEFCNYMELHNKKLARLMNIQDEEGSEENSDFDDEESLIHLTSLEKSKTKSDSMDCLFHTVNNKLEL